MPARSREPLDAVERALVRIRRDQQAGRLQRTAVPDEPAGVSSAGAARFRYLDALDDADGGAAISAVARAIGVDRPRASRLTTELLDDGLIQREPHPDDSRYAVIRLTERGRSVVDAGRAARRAAVTTALAGFTPEEAQQLAVLLERFVDAWPRGDDAGL